MKKIFLPIYQLSSLRQEPEAMAERVQYLLEDDRFLCPEGSYQVRVNSTDTHEGSVVMYRPSYSMQQGTIFVREYISARYIFLNL